MKKHRNVYLCGFTALMSLGGMFAPGGGIGSEIAFAVMFFFSMFGIVILWKEPR